jgi:hypothetical protein
MMNGMSTDVAPPVWPDPTPAPSSGSGESERPATTRFARPGALFAVAALIGVVMASLIGAAVGGLILATSSSDCTPSDGWCELGAALMGLFAGMVAGAGAYIAGGVATIRRYRPSGQRAPYVVAHLSLPVASIAVISLLGALLP